MAAKSVGCDHQDEDMIIIYARLGWHRSPGSWGLLDGGRSFVRGQQRGSAKHLWHDRVTGQSKFVDHERHELRFRNYAATTSDDPAWKMVGTGDFNQDGQPEIAWQNETTGQPAFGS